MLSLFQRSIQSIHAELPDLCFTANLTNFDVFSARTFVFCASASRLSTSARVVSTPTCERWRLSRSSTCSGTQQCAKITPECEPVFQKLTCSELLFFTPPFATPPSFLRLCSGTRRMDAATPRGVLSTWRYVGSRPCSYVSFPLAGRQVSGVWGGIHPTLHPTFWKTLCSH